MDAVDDCAAELLKSVKDIDTALDVTVFLTDLNGTPVPGETVTLTKTGSGYFGAPPGSSSFQGTTDGEGKITTTFTPTSCQSNPVLTASVSHCASAEASKTVRVLCDEPTTVDIWFCIDTTESMDDPTPISHLAHASIIKLVQDLEAAEVPLRLGGVKSMRRMALSWMTKTRGADRFVTSASSLAFPRLLAFSTTDTVVQLITNDRSRPFIMRRRMFRQAVARAGYSTSCLSLMKNRAISIRPSPNSS